jgi:hypothetical protein
MCQQWRLKWRRLSLSKGRGLVAKEFIPAGMMLLQEPALAFTRITHADMEVVALWCDMTLISFNAIWAGSVTKATFSGYGADADLELHNNKHTVQFTVASGTAPTFKSAGLASLVGRVNNSTVDTVADPIVWTMEQVHFHWGKLHDCMLCLCAPPHAARSFVLHPHLANYIPAPPHVRHFLSGRCQL